MRLEIESFKTVDGGETLNVKPSGSRRQKPNWYIWVKEDGHGILVIDSQKLRIELPANSPAYTAEFHTAEVPATLPAHSGSVLRVVTKKCTDSACPLMSFTSHEFGVGCRLYKD